MARGQIFKIHSDFYYVNSDNKIYECKAREVLKKQKQKIFVGDFVEFTDGAVEKVLPRKNFITRPAAANIDQVIVISSVKEPEIDFQTLNRYISYTKYCNLHTVLCFNKNDLSEDDKIIEKVFSIYKPLGYDVLFTSALAGYGIEELKALLLNKISVLCGASGVGKSSIINAIKPGANLKTKKVSKKTSRGTHTTRHCEIIPICKNTGIADTPGFSNLKFNFLMPNEVDLLFDEIARFKKDCKFRNCLHINEEGCAVRKNSDKIDETRYLSCIRFTEEAAEYKEQVKLRGTKVESFRKEQHNKTSVKISAQKRESSRNTEKQNIYKDIENERID